jgi:organic hydroperoxide reductase OsmC/OhrA
MREHHYELTVTLTGNHGTGTTDPRAYGREHLVTADGKPDLAGSSDPSFLGDPTRWNPEELLVAALSQCHMLWFLNLAARAGVVVTDYLDRPTGTMTVEPGGAGQFAEVVLRPEIAVATGDMLPELPGLHSAAHEMCFIARSVNFPVHHRPSSRVKA